MCYLTNQYTTRHKRAGDKQYTTRHKRADDKQKHRWQKFNKVNEWKKRKENNETKLNEKLNEYDTETDQRTSDLFIPHHFPIDVTALSYAALSSSRSCASLRCSLPFTSVHILPGSTPQRSHGPAQVPQGDLLSGEHLPVPGSPVPPQQVNRRHHSHPADTFRTPSSGFALPRAVTSAPQLASPGATHTHTHTHAHTHTHTRLLSR